MASPPVPVISSASVNDFSSLLPPSTSATTAESAQDGAPDTLYSLTLSTYTVSEPNHPGTYITSALVTAYGSISPSITAPTLSPSTDFTLSDVSTASSPPSSASSGVVPMPSSSGLDKGTKIGIAIGVCLGVIVTALVAFLVWRRKKPMKISSETTNGSSEKPELQGSQYHAAIAGPVEQKPELPTNANRHEASSRAQPALTHAELPDQSLSSGRTPATTLGALGSFELGQSASGRSRTDTDTGSDSRPLISGASHQRPSGPTHTTLQGGTSADHPYDNEADLLVQELGLISMRKKALSSAANSQGLKPEEVSGTRGDDYRELLERESKLRARIEEMDSLRES